MAKTVLIVEDESNIRELLRMYLEQEGYHVETAQNGSEGLRTFKLLKPETIEYMTRDWLLGSAAGTFPIQNYHYGLGVRSREPGTDHADFGWGGAAGAYLAVDIPHGITIYYSQHLLTSPNQSVRSRVYSAILEDLGYNVTTQIPPEPENLTY